MFNLQDTNDIELSELERLAYITGDTRTADLLARIADLEAQCEALQNQIDDTETLADWEKRNGPASAYKQFFEGCFDRLGGHYPAPSVTSDYDKNVIFEAIIRGEEQ